MARKQVAARTEGDVFQGMFFWHQAAPLLRPSSKVRRVILEHDEAAGVDDIAVYFEPPGVVDAARMCAADFFQCKYHVDRSSQYNAPTLCDPRFIGQKSSLLQRFYNAHMKLKEHHAWYRLHLVSNWQWAVDDPIGPLLRESQSGALPDRFFTDGARSRVGAIREQWRAHLGIDASDFDDFARRLRLGVDYFGRREFRSWVTDRLALHGLRELPPDQEQNVYDTLAQQFIMNGTTDFDAGTFRQMCEREGLMDPSRGSVVPKIGLRSFMRFAERMEDECDRFVCVSKHFNGRYIAESADWSPRVAQEVRAFLSDATLRRGEHHILLDCHGSLAFLAGYELDRKSGAQVFPVQKGVLTQPWKPSCPWNGDSLWRTTTTSLNSAGSDIAMAISVTHDVLDHVRRYLADGPGNIGILVDTRPSTGTGAAAISGADHAIALADSLATIIRQSRRSGVTHLFAAAPNGFLYFLGQHRASLGSIQLYEFDFEGAHAGSYSRSFVLPLT